MKTELGKYMYAVETRLEGRKTSCWTVFNTRSDDTLGHISWYGPWRQYVFDPQYGTVFNADCLHELESFLRECNRKQRQSRENA